MKTRINSNAAWRVASNLIERLYPYTERIEVAGSLRRRRNRVHDIDLVAIPKELTPFLDAARGLITGGDGASKRLTGTYREIPVDLYIATPETWATLLLIRTGSKEHNIRLAALARKKGMMLKADGSGLFTLDEAGKPSTRIAGDTEASIFLALGLPYAPPERRW